MHTPVEPQSELVEHVREHRPPGRDVRQTRPLSQLLAEHAPPTVPGTGVGYLVIMVLFWADFGMQKFETQARSSEQKPLEQGATHEPFPLESFTQVASPHWLEAEHAFVQMPGALAVAPTHLRSVAPCSQSACSLQPSPSRRWIPGVQMLTRSPYCEVDPTRCRTVLLQNWFGEQSRTEAQRSRQTPELVFDSPRAAQKAPPAHA
jgi:hypothetical protein